MNSITLPLTNVYAKGDYSATLYIGSEQRPVNVIIDTGSSTLVIAPHNEKNNYSPANDKSLTTTPAVQEVNYGIGGWAGAVVHSQIHFLAHDGTCTSSCPKPDNSDVATTTLAIVETEASATFGDADGILGMAYHHLNKSFDLTDYFKQAKITPATSYPWPFSISTNDSNAGSKASNKNKVEPPEFSDLRSFKSFLWQYPEHDIKPFFTQIADQHIVDNRFSFYAKRSSVHVNVDNINAATPSPADIDELRKDPLNNGQLILGGGEKQTGLYQGDFKTIKVLNDVYYNVELVSVQVGDNTPISAAPLAEKDVKAYFTNAIVDTGASLTVLTHELYSQVITQLNAHNTSFAKLLTPFSDINQQYKGIDASALNLAEWPDITFSFVGINTDESADENIDENTDKNTNKSNKPVELVCPPTHYWQTNTPTKGNACFKLLSQLPQWPNQTLIGLPLITNYYTIFDRSVNSTGVIKFAEQV